MIYSSLSLTSPSHTAMASEAPPEDRHRRHVAVLAFPFSSHPAALFRLSCAMAAAAPQCTFSFLSSPGPVASLSETPDRPGNLLLRCVEDGSPSSGSAATADTLARIGMFMDAAPENLRKGIAAAAEEVGEEVGCVVSDMFLWMAAEVAEEMAGVPWVAVWIGGMSALMAHIYTEKLREVFGVFRGNNANHPRADEPLDMVPCLAAYRVRDLPEGVVSDVDTPIARLLLSMAHSLPRAAAVVLNTYEGLEPSLDAEFKSRFAKYLPVGPFNLLHPLPQQQATGGSGDECLAWLDSQGASTVAYVSFGTITTLPPSELAELAHGLEASGAPFVWSLRDKEALPAGFLDRTTGKGLVVPWAPQARVLAHGAVGAFVTHCGWGSLMESMASGVPMICRPVFTDQVMSGRTVCDVWKIGFGFGGGVVTRGELVAALGKLLGGKGEGREVRERSCELKRRASRAVGPGGCSADSFTALLKIVRGSG